MAETPSGSVSPATRGEGLSLRLQLLLKLEQREWEEVNI